MATAENLNKVQFHGIQDFTDHVASHHGPALAFLKADMGAGDSPNIESVGYIHNLDHTVPMQHPPTHSH